MAELLATTQATISVVATVAYCWERNWMMALFFAGGAMVQVAAIVMGGRQ